jgi:transcriptional regulator with XRE-family HTH domain
MENENRIKLGHKLYVARTIKNLKQKHVADMLGVNQSQYQKVEAGTAGVKPPVLLKLCRILGTEYAECIHILAGGQYEIEFEERIPAEDINMYQRNKRMENLLLDERKKSAKMKSKYKEQIAGLETNVYGLYKDGVF